VRSAAGVAGVSFAFLLLWLALFAVWVRTTELHRHPVIGLPLALAVVLVLQQRFDPRPEVVSYLLLMVQVGWLATRPADRSAGAAGAALFVLTEALWVNVHGFFVLGPMVVVARLVAAITGREGRPAVRRLVVLLAVTMAATLASPFGVGAWRFVLVLAGFLREMRGEIAEFGPPTGLFLSLWTVRLFWVVWAATVVAGLWLGVRRRLSMFPALLAALGLGLGASSVRNLPLLPILAAPLWRDAGNELARALDRRLAPMAARLAVVVGLASAAAAASLALWFVVGGFSDSLRSDRLFGIGLPPHAYPVRVARYLESHPANARLFNSAADGGYLELHFPAVRVCMDSRYVEAPPVRRYFAALIQPPAFRALDAELRFDAVLLKVVDSGPLVVELLRGSGWELVWGDLHRALWVRRGSSLEPRWPVEGLHLNLGDDLSRRVNGMAAIQWTAILVQAGDRNRLVEGLDQLGQALLIPSFVVQYALQYGLAHDDREVISRARAMAPRMVALAPEHRQAVDRLLAAADAREQP